jgi:hypothetical protein
MVQAQLGPKHYLLEDKFVHWFVHQSKEKPNFSAMMMFMDEASCTWRGFSTTTTVMFEQKQTLITATNNALWSFGWEMTF